MFKYGGFFLLFAALLNRVPDAPPEERKTRSAFEYSDSPRSRRSGTDLTPQSLRFDDLPLWWYCCFDDCLIFSANSSRPSSQGPGQIAPRPSSMVVESNAPPSPSSSRSNPAGTLSANASPAVSRTNAAPKEVCQICYGRKADALLNVRGLKNCPFCKRDLTTVDVQKEVAAMVR